MINPKKIGSSIKANLVKMIRIMQITALFLSVGVGVGYADVSVAQQQTKTVTGTVVDNTNEPLIGVNVLVKGTTNGVITDIDGKFSLQQVPTGGTLQISYVGYITQEVVVGNSNTYNITLLDDSKALEEVVVTGYSTQKKRDLTGAVSVVKVDDVENVVSSNVMQNLQGRVAGVFITSNGSPNGDPTVLIRGVSTLGNAGNQSARSAPLYIIDGVPTTSNMNTLSSQDIESIQVLKDASSATIYGSRASNGVIIITTKKANREKTTVRLRASLNVKTYTEKPVNWLNTEERGWVQWRAARNDGTDPATNGWPYSFVDHQDANGNWVLDKINYPEFLDAAQTMRPADTDWVKEILQTATTQNYNVTVSSGNAAGRSLIALDYLDNVGSIKGTYNNRMSLRVNSDYSIFNNRLTIGENISLTYTKRSTQGANLNSTRQIQPIVPLHTEDGVGWGGAVGAMDDNGKNPVRIIENNKQNYNAILRLFGDVHLDLEILKNLHYKTTLGLDQEINWQRIMTLPFRDGGQSDPTTRVNQAFNRAGTLIWNNTLSYSYQLNKHNFDLMVGHEQTDNNTNQQSYVRDGYDSTDPDYMYIFAGSSGITLQQTTSGSVNYASQYRLLSYFAKANWSYDNRYLASVTVRRDGSSRFGENNKFGTFPAFSLGWRISEEGFFKEALPVVSDLKLRYGWGKTGNQQIGDFAAYGLYQATYTSDWTGRTTYDLSTAYDITGQGTGIAPMGFRRNQLANPNLRWEAATQNNIGADFGLLDQKLSGSFDYFYIKTSDILVNPPTLSVLGEGAGQSVNGAEMENKGFEFTLTYQNKAGDLRYSISGNLGAYGNKVTKLPNEVVTQYQGNGLDKTILGRARSSVFGFYTDGIFKSEEEVAAHATQAGAGVGRLRYRDIAGPNGTGPDGVITDADRDFIGKTDPDFTYGLNFSFQYKAWDLSIFFNGVQGSYANVGGSKRDEQFIGASEAAGQNYGKSTLDAWTYENPDSNIPRLSLRDVNNEKGRMSTYFLENTSYLKLRNVEIGYNLPSDILKKALIKDARVYLMGENLLKFASKDFTGADPETPNRAYPIPLSVSVGFNVTF
jgi:TonB-linked SusC/RagA family outer membrane protein